MYNLHSPLPPTSTDCNRYATSGRIQIASFLRSDDASRLLRKLETSVAWKLVFNRGDLVYELNREQTLALGDQKLTELQNAIHLEGRYKFQYLYENIRCETADAATGQETPSELEAFAAFMNSSLVLDFARTLTDCPQIAFADCQATRFRQGHFLNSHEDDVDGKNRVAAYVFNLTPRWDPCWGGQLQFISPSGQIAEAFVPTFNALNVLKVPQPHLVSAVTPLADPEWPRVSVTGWFRRR